MKVAILIGCSYCNTNQKLKSSEKDILLFEKCIRNYDKIIKISQKNEIYPSKENIINSIVDELNNLNDDDRILIYYTGHGGKEYLIKSNDFKYITSLEIINIINKNLKINNYLFLILDSCYSGQIIDYVNEIPNKKINIITSSSNNEKSKITINNANSCFTIFLCEFIRDINQIKITECLEYFAHKYKNNNLNYSIKIFSNENYNQLWI